MTENITIISSLILSLVSEAEKVVIMTPTIASHVILRMTNTAAAITREQTPCPHVYRISEGLL